MHAGMCTPFFESGIIALKDCYLLTKPVDGGMARRKKTVRYCEIPQRANAFVIKPIAAQEGPVGYGISLTKICVWGAFDLNQTGPGKSLLAFRQSGQRLETRSCQPVAGNLHGYNVRASNGRASEL